jgi:hypothetical protein
MTASSTVHGNHQLRRWLRGWNRTPHGGDSRCLPRRPTLRIPIALYTHEVWSVETRRSWLGELCPVNYVVAAGHPVDYEGRPCLDIPPRETGLGNLAKTRGLVMSQTSFPLCRVCGSCHVLMPIPKGTSCWTLKHGSRCIRPDAATATLLPARYLITGSYAWKVI